MARTRDYNEYLAMGAMEEWPDVTAEEDYPCTVCDKICRTKEHLKVHMRRAVFVGCFFIRMATCTATTEPRTQGTNHINAVNVGSSRKGLCV